MADLVSIQEVRSYIGNKENSLDDELETIIDWVSATIQTKAGQPIAQASVSYPFTGNGTAKCRLPHHPVSAVSAMTSADLTTVGQELDDVTEEFDVVQIGSLYYLRINGVFSSARRYNATLSVGYATVPQDVKQVAIEMIQVCVRESKIANVGQDMLGKQTVSIADAASQITRTTQMLDLNPRWLAMLKPYYATRRMI